MKALKFVLNLLFHVVGFAIGGLLYGIAIGVVIGMGFSALLCILLFITGIRAAGIGTVFIGFMYGGTAGAFIGGLIGLVSFIALAVAISHRPDPDLKFLNAIAGAFRASWICTLAGSLSGALFIGLWELNFGRGSWQQSLKSAFEPFVGGFFWGSITGFCIGFFAGTLIGGLSRKPNWLTLPLSEVRVELKAKIGAMWKSESQ